MHALQVQQLGCIAWLELSAAAAAAKEQRAETGRPC
jgi:hypothetical protein